MKKTFILFMILFAIQNVFGMADTTDTKATGLPVHTALKPTDIFITQQDSNGVGIWYYHQLKWSNLWNVIFDSLSYRLTNNYIPYFKDGHLANSDMIVTGSTSKTTTLLGTLVAPYIYTYNQTNSNAYSLIRDGTIYLVDDSADQRTTSIYFSKNGTSNAGTFAMGKDVTDHSIYSYFYIWQAYGYADSTQYTGGATANNDVFAISARKKDGANRWAFGSGVQGDTAQIAKYLFYNDARYAAEFNGINAITSGDLGYNWDGFHSGIIMKIYAKDTLDAFGYRIMNQVGKYYPLITGTYANPYKYALAIDYETGDTASFAIVDLMNNKNMFYINNGNLTLPSGVRSLTINAADNTELGGLNIQIDGGGGYHLFAQDGVGLRTNNNLWVGGTEGIFLGYGGNKIYRVADGTIGVSSKLNIAGYDINTISLNLAGRLGLDTSSVAGASQFIYMPTATDAYTGSLKMQAGGGSGGYGGGITMYGASNPTNQGGVSINLSAMAGAKFAINNDGLGTGTDIFTIDRVTGLLHITPPPTYADNTAALAGGLVSGDVYKTATGQLMTVY